MSRVMVTALLLLGGCSSEAAPSRDPQATEPPFTPATVAPTPPWDESRIERQIRTGLVKGAKVAVVASCSEPARWAVGETFPCLVAFPEQLSTQRIRVTMKADRTYDWSIRLAG